MRRERQNSFTLLAVLFAAAHVIAVIPCFVMNDTLPNISDVINTSCTSVLFINVTVTGNLTVNLSIGAMGAANPLAPNITVSLVNMTLRNGAALVIGRETGSVSPPVSISLLGLVGYNGGIMLIGTFPSGTSIFIDSANMSADNNYTAPTFPLFDAANPTTVKMLLLARFILTNNSAFVVRNSSFAASPLVPPPFKCFPIYATLGPVLLVNSSHIILTGVNISTMNSVALFLFSGITISFQCTFTIVSSNLASRAAVALQISTVSMTRGAFVVMSSSLSGGMSIPGVIVTLSGSSMTLVHCVLTSASQLFAMRISYSHVGLFEQSIFAIVASTLEGGAHALWLEYLTIAASGQSSFIVSTSNLTSSGTAFYFWWFTNSITLSSQSAFSVVATLMTSQLSSALLLDAITISVSNGSLLVIRQCTLLALSPAASSTFQINGISRVSISNSSAWIMTSNAFLCSGLRSALAFTVGPMPISLTNDSFWLLVGNAMITTTLQASPIAFDPNVSVLVDNSSWILWASNNMSSAGNRSCILFQGQVTISILGNWSFVQNNCSSSRSIWWNQTGMGGDFTSSGGGSLYQRCNYQMNMSVAGATTGRKCGNCSCGAECYALVEKNSTDMMLMIATCRRDLCVVAISVSASAPTTASSTRSGEPQSLSLTSTQSFLTASSDTTLSLSLGLSTSNSASQASPSRTVVPTESWTISVVSDSRSPSFSATGTLSSLSRADTASSPSSMTVVPSADSVTFSLTCGSAATDTVFNYLSLQAAASLPPMVFIGRAASVVTSDLVLALADVLSVGHADFCLQFRRPLAARPGIKSAITTSFGTIRAVELATRDGDAFTSLTINISVAMPPTNLIFLSLPTVILINIPQSVLTLSPQCGTLLLAPTGLDVSLTFAPLKLEVLGKSGTTAVAVAANTAGIVGSIFGNPVVATQQGTFVAMAELTSCGFSDVESISSGVLLFGFGFGDRVGFYYRGVAAATFFTAAVGFGLLLPIALFAIFTSVVQAKPFKTALRRAMAMAHFPGILVVPFSSLLLPSLISSTSLLRLSLSASDIALALLAIAMNACMIFAGYLISAERYFRCVKVTRGAHCIVPGSSPTEHRDRLEAHSNICELSGLEATFVAYVEWSGKWEDTSKTNFKKRWHMIFDGYKVPWYPAAEMALVGVQGLILGIRINAPVMCVVQSGCLFMVNLVSLVLAAYYQPAGALFDQHCLVLGKATTQIICFLSVLTMTGLPSADVVASWLQFTATLIGSAQIVPRLLLTFLGAVRYFGRHGIFSSVRGNFQPRVQGAGANVELLMTASNGLLEGGDDPPPGASITRPASSLILVDDVTIEPSEMDAPVVFSDVSDIEEPSNEERVILLSDIVRGLTDADAWRLEKRRFAVKGKKKSMSTYKE